MENVLVTGGAGYIGSHTCKLLAKAGYRPVSYDNLTTGHRAFVNWGPLETGDLHDTENLGRVLQLYEPCAVIHFAGSAYVRESIINPFQYYRNNVGATLSLLEAMRQAGIHNLVFSSSCTVYGDCDVHTIDEACPLTPINPYGRSKRMIEEMLFDLAQRNEIRYLSLRYFNAAGADREGDLGERHDPEPHLIPLAIRSAMGGQSLEVFGTDFPTSDGTAVRDYVHVEDLARAHILAIEYLLAGGASDAMNLGTGKGHSIREILSVLQILGLNVKTQDGPRRAGDPPRAVAAADKAGHILGWRPAYVDIGDILQTAVAWHLKGG